jgi:hypothetical protein
VQIPPVHFAPPQHIEALVQVVPGTEQGWQAPPLQERPWQQSSFDRQSRPRV